MTIPADPRVPFPGANLHDASSGDVRAWQCELQEAGWTAEHATLYKAPCGCYFRGPWRAWQQMKAGHVSACLVFQTASI